MVIRFEHDSETVELNEAQALDDPLLALVLCALGVIHDSRTHHPLQGNAIGTRPVLAGRLENEIGIAL